MNILRIFIVSLLIILTACSSNKNTEQKTAGTGTGTAATNVISQDEATNLNDQSASDDNKNTLHNTNDSGQSIDKLITSSNQILDYKGIKSKYGISKNVVNLLNDGLLPSTDLKLDPYLNIKSVPKVSHIEIASDGRQILVETTPNTVRQTPIIMAVKHQSQTLEEYATKFFPQYTLLAKTLFQSTKKINISDITGFAQYIDSNFVIIKSFYEDEIKAYIYQIGFYKGDISDVKSYWYRYSSEAPSVSQTMTKLRIYNINSFLNVAAPIEGEMPDLEQPEEESPVPAVDSTPAPVKKNDQTAENNINDNDFDADTTDNVQTSDQKNDINQTADNDTTTPDTQDTTPTQINNKTIANEKERIGQRGKTLSAAEAISAATKESSLDPSIKFKDNKADLQRKLINFRLQTVVGLWKNVLDNTVYEIREMEYPNGENKFKALYTGYILFDKAPKYKPDVNKNLSWLSEDLKFQFRSDGSEAFYIDDNKIISSIDVNLFEAKGLIELSLPNSKTIYLEPIVPDLDQVVNKDLYQPLIDQYSDNAPLAIKRTLEKNEDPIVINNELSDEGVPFFVGWTITIGGLSALFLALALV